MNYKSAIIVNEKHKDTLFRIIFKDKKELLSLYNALSGTDYRNPDDLTINTRRDVIYIHMKNDVSFILDDHLCLYEHQSTFNPNMPLRGLLYLTDLYKPYIDNRRIYTSKLMKLPNPRYIVFYNGTKEMPDSTPLRLSDAFIHPEEISDIEVTAHMFNINFGHNKELMDKCKKLKEYAAFISIIRKYRETGMEIETAIQLAMDECIKNDILAEILRKEKMIVMNSILTEFDEQAYAEGLREDGFEDGFADGLQQGVKQGIQQGIQQGVKQGIQQSIQTLVETCMEFNLTKQETLDRIITKIRLSQEEAEGYIEQFWK